jgi:hypothetical protein
MSYSSVANHGAMVFDQHRNALYARAISRHVRPDTVVLDLGAGLGVHALLAAAAGAPRVYMVEPEPILNVAEAAARANGFEARVIPVQRRIEDVQLPEQVDLIVSVFTGNLLFSEDLLPSLFHARDHYLRPGGHLVPDCAQLWLAPLNAPVLHAKHVARWAEPVQGLDYSCGRSFAANDLTWLRREDLQGSHQLGQGAAVADLDLSTATSADCDGACTCRIDAEGQCHGLLAWIRIRLGEEWLSSSPADPEVHWAPVLLPLDPPLQLLAGEDISIALQRPAFGDWTWTVRSSAGTRRHSTFLARTEGPREMARATVAIPPGLSDRGRRVMQALELLGQGLSIGATVQALARDSQVGQAQLLREVQSLALKYGDK